jgi:exodeoxyribonuclease VII small subunit
MPTPTKTSEFEESIHQLNHIVESLETGNLKLEDALSQYEKAISLVRHCQTTLDKAEQRIKILNDNNQLEEMAHDAYPTD